MRSALPPLLLGVVGLGYCQAVLLLLPLVAACWALRAELLWGPQGPEAEAALLSWGLALDSVAVTAAPLCWW